MFIKYSLGGVLSFLSYWNIYILSHATCSISVFVLCVVSNTHLLYIVTTFSIHQNLWTSVGVFDKIFKKNIHKTINSHVMQWSFVMSRTSSGGGGDDTFNKSRDTHHLQAIILCIVKDLGQWAKTCSSGLQKIMGNDLLFASPYIQCVYTHIWVEKMFSPLQWGINKISCWELNMGYKSNHCMRET